MIKYMAPPTCWRGHLGRKKVYIPDLRVYSGIKHIVPVFREVYAMAKHRVITFKPFLFEAGQKIHIGEGPRKGDWEVLEVTEHKVKLRCPVTHKEFNWNRFCYFEEERDGVEWPQRD